MKRFLKGEGSDCSTDRTNGDTVDTEFSCQSHGGQVKQSKAVNRGRYVFVILLMTVAGVLGAFTWYLLNETEIDLADEQYHSTVDQALKTSQRIAVNKLLGAAAMAQVAGYTFPDKDSWPLVIVKGWYGIAKYVAPTSIVGGLSLSPIIDPLQPGLQQAFEDMAYSHYEQVFPGGNAGTAGGKIKGIWIKDATGNVTHDTTGDTYYGSKYRILAPKTEHSLGNHPLLMMNVHGFKEQGNSIDTALDCALERANAEDPASIDCASVGDLVAPKDPNDPRGPGAFVATPIYPANYNTTVVGFVFAKLNWNEVLEAIFPKEMSGIDCVVKTFDVNKQLLHSATYTIVDGSGVYRGPGDLHDSNYDKYEVSEQILDETPLSEGSIAYKLFFYPTADFDEVYRSKNPMIASIGAVLIMLITSAVFFLYDFFVRREFNAKRELLDAKRQFVRFVSHEVRTPLNSVCMGLTLLQEELAQSLGFKNATEMGMSDETTRLARAKAANNVESMDKNTGWFELVQEIQTNASSSVDVLNDLLNYDKIESGTLSLELTVISIWELVQKTVHEFKLPAATKKINFKLKMPQGDAEAGVKLPKEITDQKIVGDSVRITQVIRNLVSNALKFTPENGNLTVEADWVLPTTADAKKRAPTKSFKLKNQEIITHDWSGDLVLKVIDSGAGMTKEQLSKLFGQGVQFNVNELQSGNGSGLGLFIAKGIVEQHNGTLVADSKGLGCGTVFTMTIPLYNIPSSEEESAKSVERQESGSVNSVQFSPLRILVVDDATSNRKLLVRLLKNVGHDCDQTEDGIYAVEMVRTSDNTENAYDIVLLDYEMPQMNGPTAASEIRAMGSDVFIVGITGNMMAEDVEFFRACGANAVLPKPFKMENLEEVLFEYNITSGSR